MNSTSHNGTSTLTFVPASDDSGKHLSCRAENSQIINSRIEDGWKLEVHCKYRRVLSSAFMYHDHDRQVVETRAPTS